MLIRPNADWPLLICGPILRRVTATDVTVFAATRKPCDVQVAVRDKNAGGSWLESPALRTRALGTALHVVVCHFKPAAALKPGVVYEYDLRMQPTDLAATETLASQAGLLTGSGALGYEPGQLPTFAVPPPLSSLNIIHGSCRKPHGGGGVDGFIMVDDLIRTARKAPLITDRALTRPHLLVLTGDQIYADDVALTMLATIHEAAVALGLPEETFPDGAAGVEMTDAEVRPGMARQSFITTHTKVSSQHAMNHLLFFVEFCAMYILCWSDELWPRGADGQISAGTATIEPALQEQNKKELRHLDGFLRSLRTVRRAMANVPTMMTFDDHEISDDWNIDGEWAEASRTDQGLHRIVRNGLLAYAVFQAWGNDPDRFAAKGVPDELLSLVTIPAGKTAPPISATPAAADAALRLTTETAEAATLMTWSWTLDGEEHRVIALDTRTVRDFKSLRGPKGEMNRPGLLTEVELDEQLTKHKIADKLCFVIAAAPIFGHPLADDFVKEFYAEWDSRAADHELWMVNPITFQSVLRRLAAFTRVVVLSGDVHYSYSSATNYFGADGRRARIVQLCASAAKNSEGMTRFLETKPADLVTRQVEWPAWLALTAPLSTFERETLEDLTLVSPFDKTLRVLNRILLFKLFDPPPMVPTGPWTDIAQRTVVRGLAARNHLGDFRYQTRFAVDVRNGPTRLATATEIDPDLDPFADLHTIQEARRIVVGIPTIGQVRFTTNEAEQFVVHRLHWLTTIGPDARDHACTEHTLPLHPPTADMRPEPS